MYYKKIVLIAAALTLAVMTADAQERTVGLMLNEEGSFDGYTLFSPLSFTTTYLINNEGLLVRSWESRYRPESAFQSEDGYLYRGIITDSLQPVFGRPMGGIEKQDWDGSGCWFKLYSSDNYSPHHDLCVLPNGNVILVAFEAGDSAEVIQMGRNRSTILTDRYVFDFIVELEQTGDSAAAAVWEWHFRDHLIQDFDRTKDNYGVVGDHPERIDINGGYLREDWPHLNSVAYNQEFDQIMLSCAYTSEIYIIDHSTTTEEARGHFGGHYGKGGDILYRWGNPQIYRQGDSTDQRLFTVHDGQWVASGPSNIIMFNNGTGRGYSSVEEIVPPVDATGNYLLTGSKYGPDTASWTWTAPTPEDFFGPTQGSVQRLPNGNTLIVNSRQGEFFEVAPTKEKLWAYINPVSDQGPVRQGDSITFNQVYKVRRYSADYSGFAGKDLTPDGPIELPAAVEEIKPATHLELKLSQNPFTHSVEISYQVGAPGQVRIKLYNALGQEVRTLVGESKPAGSYKVRWNATDNLGQRLSSGVYFCQFQAGPISLQKRIVLIR